MIIVCMLLSMSVWLGLVVTTLAVARATRLVATDKISEPMRVAAARRLAAGSGLAYLLHCRWCVSIWISLPAGAATCGVYGWSLWWWLPLALAYSYATGLLVRAEPV